MDSLEFSLSKHKWYTLAVLVGMLRDKYSVEVSIDGATLQSTHSSTSAKKFYLLVATLWLSAISYPAWLLAGFLVSFL